MDDGRSVALITAPARRQAAVVDERLRICPSPSPRRDSVRAVTPPDGWDAAAAAALADRQRWSTRLVTPGLVLGMVSVGFLVVVMSVRPGGVAAAVLLIGGVFGTIGAAGLVGVGATGLARARAIRRVLAAAPLEPAGPCSWTTVTMTDIEGQETSYLLIAVARPDGSEVRGRARALVASDGWGRRGTLAEVRLAGPVEDRSVVAVDGGTRLLLTGPIGWLHRKRQVEALARLRP